MINSPEKLANCDKRILQLVDFLEQIFGTITINSGFRTPEQNQMVGGVQNSAHVKGLAVDLSSPNISCIKIASKILENISNYPIKGMGIDLYANYCHADFMDRGTKDITYWSYDRSGRAI